MSVRMIGKGTLILLAFLLSNKPLLSSTQPPGKPKPPRPPPCMPSDIFQEMLSSGDLNRAGDVCTLRSDSQCTRHLCPQNNCRECDCLFNRNNCASDNPEHCMNVALTLGLNCGSTQGPVDYVVAALNDTIDGETTTSVIRPCLLDRICQCLSRNANHSVLAEIEEICRQVCLRPIPNISNSSANTSSDIMGVLHGDNEVCDPVQSQYCRRHRRQGRPAECARVCVLEDSCDTLIEGILEDDFEGSDLDAAVSVMREFRLTGSHPRHVRRLRRTYRRLFRAIERNESTAILHLNDTNSITLMSLFDDLLSDGRQAQWNELQEEEKRPGQEILERIEDTSYLLGRSQQLRPTDLQLLQHFQYIGTNIALNVECQSESDVGYEHVFQRDVQVATLSLPPNADFVDGNKCIRIISAALSSNLGDYVTSTNISERVNSDIMTVEAVEMEDTLGPLSDIRITFRSLNTSNEFSNATCIFWDINESQWSTEGVVLLSQNATHYTCQSTHLTSFAVLVSVTPEQVSGTEAKALSIATYIGCSISILCLTLTLLLLVALRKALNKGVLLYVHFNLFLVLLLALIVFVAGIETAVHINWLCTTVAAVLHYLFLCVFCWMLAEGIVLYMLVVRAFTTALEKWYYLILLGWGVPIPIVAVSLGMRHEYYGTTTLCWLSQEKGVIWSFIAPMLAVISINTVILVLTVGSIVRVKRKAVVNMDSNDRALVIASVKNTVVLLPLLGITWIIGLFAVNENTTVFAWTFTILNSLQGVMIFVLHILRNKLIWTKILSMCGLDKSTDLEKRHSISTEYTTTGKRNSEQEAISSNSNNDTHMNQASPPPSTNCSYSPRSPLEDSRSSGSHEYQTSVMDFSDIPSD